jgi:hypothetical protein
MFDAIKEKLKIMKFPSLVCQLSFVFVELSDAVFTSLVLSILHFINLIPR